MPASMAPPGAFTGTPSKGPFDIFSNPQFMNFAGNALSDLGYGLARSPTFGGAFGVAAERGAEMAPARDAFEAQKRAEAERLQNINESQKALQQFPDLVAAVSAGLPVKDAYNEMFKRMSPDYQGGAVDAPASVREWEYYNSLSPDEQGQYLRMKRANPFLDAGDRFVQPDPVTGEVSGDPIVKQGSPSANMDVTLGPDGRSMQPAAGSPEALDRQQAHSARATASRQADERSAFVIHHIDQALEKSGFWTTGMAGSAGRAIGLPPAIEVETAINPIVANLGFQELQAMREASPTGGALGQVTERELAMLQATVTSLDPRQGEEQLDANLRLVKNLLKRNQIYRQLARDGIPLDSQQAQAMLNQFPLPGQAGGAARTGTTSTGVSWSAE
jgi:hypothetical protein